MSARGAVLVALLSASAGCALLGKGEPLRVRYFDLRGSDIHEPRAHLSSARLRLGTVSAVRAVDRRFASRTSAHELRYDDALRFTDQPEKFLARDLSRHLFEGAGVTRVMAGLAPTLEVELTAFEARPQAQNVHVSARALLHDDREQLWQQTFEEERPVGSGESAEALAEALSDALARLAAEITDEALRRLLAYGARTPEPRATREWRDTPTASGTN